MGRRRPTGGDACGVAGTALPNRVSTVGADRDRKGAGSETMNRNTGALSSHVQGLPGAVSEVEQLHREEVERRAGASWGWWTPPLAILGIVAAWEGLTRLLDVPPYVVPGPWTIGAAIHENWATIAENAWVTTIEALGGFVIGNLVAFVLAIGFVYLPLMEQTVFPLAVALRAVPFVALAPILILWMGNGMAPKVTIACLMVFFPSLVNMVRGLRSPEREALELMRTLSASWWQTLWKLRLPASMPYLLAALKIASASVVIGAVVAEYIGAKAGLGYLVVASTYQLKIPLLWGTIAVASGLSLVLFALVTGVERLLMRGKWGQADLAG